MVLEVLIVILITVIIGFGANIAENIKSDKNNRISFKEAMELAELPVVTFYNGKEKLNFLLDTGATMNAINSSYLSKLTYSKSSDVNFVFGIEGNTKEVSSIYMEFERNNKKYKSLFQVMDLQSAFNAVKQESGVTIHGILGSGFFEEYKYVIDFNNLVVYSKHE